jgi:hypothetical protein
MLEILGRKIFKTRDEIRSLDESNTLGGKKKGIKLVFSLNLVFS